MLISRNESKIEIYIDTFNITIYREVSPVRSGDDKYISVSLVARHAENNITDYTRFSCRDDAEVFIRVE